MLIVIFFHFSYEEVPYPDVTIHKVAENRYEIMFRYQVKISGNMHGPSLPFTGSRYDSVKWMYINKATGEMDASDVVLTQYRGCKDPLYWQQNMQGSIVITENKIKFLIEMPRYTTADGQSSNLVQNYVKWEHNGEYNLENKVPLLAGLLSLNDRPCDTYNN